MRLINADLYWDKLIARRELNISAGLPAAYNSGINQAISILNGMETEDEVDYEQLEGMLGLWAKAPENAPEDWCHHADENIAAWHEFLAKSKQRGYYALPLEGWE